MNELNPERIAAYRIHTFRTRNDLRLKSAEEALAYVNERGFVFFWPNKGYLLPSLWTAAAGDRPVADEHDDPGHITWGWKDGMLGQHRWYYARLVRRRNTVVSLANAPYFYALSPNFGDPEHDYIDQYEMGVLTMEAKNVYEALLREGPLDTIALRKAARMSANTSDGRFNKAIEALQVEMKVLPVGTAEVGSWKYAFIYDIAARHFPELDPQARTISEEEARQKLAADYFSSLGAVPENELHRMFSWRPADCQKAIQANIDCGLILNDLSYPGHKLKWISLVDLVDPA